MSGRPSSLVKCTAFLCGALLLFGLVKLTCIIKSHQDAVVFEQIKLPRSDPTSDRPNKTTVPLERLLDLAIKFKFLMKPKNVCDQSKRLLIFVHSRVGNFGARNAIRSTWGSLQSQLNYRLVFLIGLQQPTSESIEQLLSDEQRLNDDLVRGNFIDRYRNLTLKHVMGYKYALHYCSTADFVMKADDDAFINIFEIADLLGIPRKVRDTNHVDRAPSPRLKRPDDYERRHNLPEFQKGYGEIRLLNSVLPGEEPIHGKSILGKSIFGKSTIYNQRRSLADHRKTIQRLSERNIKFIACSLFPFGTETRRTGKWSLTKAEYDPDYLPAYCSGIAYLLNAPALLTIYEQAHQMQRPFFIDDLFLTGIVVQQVLRQTNYPNYSNYLNDSNDYSSSDTDFSAAARRSARLFASQPQRSDSPATGKWPAARRSHHLAATADAPPTNYKSDFQVLDWSELYNYRWSQFIEALAQPDNSFNSVFFINDLDRMPNRRELVEIAWKKIENYYLYT